MDLEALGQWMIRRGALDPAGLERARRRQRLYGGTLDTSLLELGLCDERTVLTNLAEATGLPAWRRPSLEDAVPADVASLMDARTARRLGAQPVAIEGEALQVVVRFGADLDAAATSAGRFDRETKFHMVTELRLEALWARMHGASLPTRFATLLGKLVGAGKAHRSIRTTPARGMERPLVETGPTPRRKTARARLPTPLVTPVVGAVPAAAASPVPAPSAEPITAPATMIVPAAAIPPTTTATPPVAASAAMAAAPSPAPATPAVSTLPPSLLVPPSIDIEENLEESLEELLPLLEAAPPGSAERLSVLRRLRPFADDRLLDARLVLWRARVAEGDEEAARALGAIADRQSVPALLELLPSETATVRDAALAALRAITLHDFGTSRWRWARWWREFSDRHRAEWLLDALDARDPELRLEAARELERLSGRYVGYHFDLSKRDREEARRRWQDWWQTTGRAMLGQLR